MNERSASTRFRIVPGFAVPFVHTQYPSADRLNPVLRTLFLARESEGERHRNDQAIMNVHTGLFESKWEIFEWTDAPVVELRNFCMSAVRKAVAELSGYDVARMSRLEARASAWFHVTRRNGYFAQHNHPMASWSGVYCVSAGEDSSGDPQSGALVFANPHGIATGFLDLGSSELKMPWGTHPISLRLQAGQLVLFPSWLMHQVMPFRGEGERITLAFNAWFRERN